MGRLPDIDDLFPDDYEWEDEDDEDDEDILIGVIDYLTRER